MCRMQGVINLATSVRHGCLDFASSGITRVIITRVIRKSNTPGEFKVVQVEEG